MQFDLFGQTQTSKGLQTLGYHYQIKKTKLEVTDLATQVDYIYTMRGVIYPDLKTNVLHRLKKAQADPKTLPARFFKSFMTLAQIQNEIKQLS